MANRFITVTDSAVGSDDLADNLNDTTYIVSDSASGVDTASLLSQTAHQSVTETGTAIEGINLTVYTNGIWQYAYYDPFLIQGARDPSTNSNYVHPAGWLKNSPSQDWED